LSELEDANLGKILAPRTKIIIDFTYYDILDANGIGDKK
jgi:hypothetical protein